MRAAHRGVERARLCRHARGHAGVSAAQEAKVQKERDGGAAPRLKASTSGPAAAARQRVVGAASEGHQNLR